MMHNFKDAQKIAKEWARELNALSETTPWPVLSEEVAWGFAEVEKGGNPTQVMNQMKERISERLKGGDAQ